MDGAVTGTDIADVSGQKRATSDGANAASAASSLESGGAPPKKQKQERFSVAEHAKELCAEIDAGNVGKDHPLAWIRMSGGNHERAWYITQLIAGRGYCKCCSKNDGDCLSADKWSNLLIHAKAESHKRAWAVFDFSESKSTLTSPSMLEKMSQKSLEDAMTYATAPKDARDALCFRLLRYVSKTNIPLLLNDPHIVDMIGHLKKKYPNLLVAEGGVMDRCATGGLALQKKLIRDVLKKESMALLNDIAFHDGPEGRTGVVALIAATSAHEAPILLGIFYDVNIDEGDDDPLDEDPPSSSNSSSSSSASSSSASAVKIEKEYQKVAKAIKAKLAEYEIDLNTQVTALVGDGHTFNDGLAKELGITRLWCIPHVLALAFKAFIKHFPLFKDCTLGLSSVLRAGGGGSRDAVLRSAGIKPRDLYCLSTRWLQMYGSMKCQLSIMETSPAGEPKGGYVFDVIRECLADGAFTSGKADEGKIIDKNKTPLKSMLANIKTHFEVGTPSHKRKHYLEIEYRLVEEITKEMNLILGLASADANTVDISIIDRLEAYQKKLEILQKEGMASVVWSILFSKEPDNRNSMSVKLEAVEQAIKSKYNPIIRQACADAHEVLMKYLPKAVSKLKYRLMYDPAREPIAIPVMTEGTDFDAPAFFGCLPDADAIPLIAEQFDFCKKWKTLGHLKTLPIGTFWRHPEIVKAYPNLSKLGQWYASFPTSNVACERVFSILRAFEGGTRWGLVERSVEEELMCKVNRHFTDKLAETCSLRLQRAATFTSSSSNSSSSASSTIDISRD